MKAINAGNLGSRTGHAEARVGAYNAYAGRAYNTEFRYELPEIYDANDDDVSISMFLGDASEFLMFDKENGVL